MNKVKTAFWVIIFGFFILIFVQNQLFFMAKQSIRMNLVFKEYQSPEVATAVFFLAFFLLGLLISYFFSLAERLRLKKKIKRLSAVADPVPKTPSTEPAAEPSGDGSVEKQEDVNASAS